MSRVPGCTSVDPGVKSFDPARSPHALVHRTATDHARTRVSVIEVVAGVTFAGLSQRVPVRLLGPRAFGQLNVVVLEQRSLAEMDVGNRLVVLDDRPIEVGLGIGSPTLAIEHEIDGALASLDQSH